MKFFARLMPVVVILLLVVSPLLVSAQGGTDPLCSGLSEADCQLLQETLANVSNVTSFTTPTWEISASLTSAGMNSETGETTMQTFELTARGSGGGFSFSPDGTLLVHLNIEEASVVTPDETQSVAMEVILTEKMVFVKFEGEWYGDEVTAEDLESLGLGDVAGMAEGAAEGGLGLNTDQLGIDLTGIVTTTRLADENGDAVYSTAIDIPQLLIAVLSSPSVGDLLGAAMGGGDTGESMALTPEDVQMLGMFIQPLLAGTTLNVGLHINADAKTISVLAVDMNINIDASMLLPELGKITGEVHFMVELANVNEPFEVTLPESYRPMEDLQPQLDALGLSM